MKESKIFSTVIGGREVTVEIGGIVPIPTENV